jgi:hypothetical protein
MDIATSLTGTAKEGVRDYFAPLHMIREAALDFTTRRWAAQKRANIRKAHDLVTENFTEIDAMLENQASEEACETALYNLGENFYTIYVLDRNHAFDDGARAKMAESVDRLLAGCSNKSVEADELYAVALFVPEAADLIRKHAEKFDHLNSDIFAKFHALTPEDQAAKQVISSGGKFIFDGSYGTQDRVCPYPMAYIKKTRNSNTDEIKVRDYYCLEEAENVSRDDADREIETACASMPNDTSQKKATKMKTRQRLEIFRHAAELFFQDRLKNSQKSALMQPT